MFGWLKRKSAAVEKTTEQINLIYQIVSRHAMAQEHLNSETTFLWKKGYILGWVMTLGQRGALTQDEWLKISDFIFVSLYGNIKAGELDVVVKLLDASNSLDDSDMDKGLTVGKDEAHEFLVSSISTK